MVGFSKGKVCQKVSLVPACGGNVGETGTLSATELSSTESQECVGDCDCAVDSDQSPDPWSLACVQPGLSKPPAPSKVSVRKVVIGPVGVALRAMVFPSSRPFELSTARAT